MSKEPNDRPTIIEIYNHDFFLDPLVRLMHSLKLFK